MCLLMIILGIIIFMFVIISLYKIEFFNAEIDTFCGMTFGVCCGISIIMIFVGISCYAQGHTDLDCLLSHLDHSKTRTIKENGAVTDLYLTIDGKEYHFEFETKEE